MVHTLCTGLTQVPMTENKTDLCAPGDTMPLFKHIIKPALLQTIAHRTLALLPFQEG